jgi:hypothetical protein
MRNDVLSDEAFYDRHSVEAFRPIWNISFVSEYALRNVESESG